MLKYNNQNGNFLVNDTVVELLPLETEILLHLWNKRGEVLDKKTLYQDIYKNQRRIPAAKIIDVLICKIRQKLKQAGGGAYIQTLWGVGYALQAEDAA